MGQHGRFWSWRDGSGRLAPRSWWGRIGPFRSRPREIDPVFRSDPAPDLHVSYLRHFTTLRSKGGWGLGHWLATEDPAHRIQCFATARPL
jgi:hypothetical protein